MAAMVSISQPEALKTKGNLADNWRQWKQNFDIYLIAAGVNQQEDKVTCALFLHVIGQHGRDIFNELDISEPHTLKDFYIKFDQYCNPKTNLTFDRYKFFNTKQEKNQQFDKFLLALRQKSKNCEFGDLSNSLLMTQIISGIANTLLRERLLRTTDLDLNQTIEECRSAELAESQAKLIATATTAKQPPRTSEKKEKNFNAHKNKNPKTEKNQSLQQEWCVVPTGKKDVPAGVRTNCKFCAGTHKYGDCPAFGTTCNKCQKPNHYAKVCRN